MKKKKIYIDDFKDDDVEYICDVLFQIGIENVICNVSGGYVLVKTNLDDDVIDDAVFDAGLDCEGIENIE